MIITGKNIYRSDFTFRPGTLTIENGRITDISDGEYIKATGGKSIRREVRGETAAGAEVVDAGDAYVIPGLTDIHFHGAAGADFSDGTEKSIAKIAAYERSRGVTNICPATMTLPRDLLVSICKTAAAHVKKTGRGEDFDTSLGQAELVGINLEGPFVSPDKLGAQNPEYVYPPDAAFLQDLMEAGEGLPKLITVAPEMEGAMEFIEKARDRIRISIGHTCADYDTAREAYEKGARHLTHLYNAMPGIRHREPGVIPAAAEQECVTAEMICDGLHVHPSVMRASFKMFPDRIVIISDSARACGMPDGEYTLGGLPIFKKDNAARLADGTIAGSILDQMSCLCRAIRENIPVETAVRAATYTPAKAIGILDQLGTLEIGKLGRVVLLGKDLEVKRVIM